jgi:hypothetical protein
VQSRPGNNDGPRDFTRTTDWRLILGHDLAPLLRPQYVISVKQKMRQTGRACATFPEASIAMFIETDISQENAVEPAVVSQKSPADVAEFVFIQ